MKVAEFSYELPPEAVAQQPAEPRDAARLLDTRDLSDHRFRDLPDLLEPGDLVVVNQTRVRKGRLRGRKVPTGGAVEVLLLGRRGREVWEALIRPARRIRAGMRLDLGRIRGSVVTPPADGRVLLHLEADDDIEGILEREGDLPLPPYIHGWEGDPERYQTVFATSPGSAAAPTAGLHFTPRVLSDLQRRGIGLARVDLEVGLATFRPMTADDIEDHVIHPERFLVPEETATAIEETSAAGGRVVAIGTTVVRTLETMAAAPGVVLPGRGETRLYLRPGFDFRIVDILVTNFHLPRSSLLVLLAGFMGDGWRKAYHVALERGYRFLSFGDAMLCVRRDR